MFTVNMDVAGPEEPEFDDSRPSKLKKSTKKANMKARAHYDEVNVLVTGFGVCLAAHMIFTIGF